MYLQQNCHHRVQWFFLTLWACNMPTLGKTSPFLLLLLLATLFHLSHGDVGTSSHYRPPYLRKCPVLLHLQSYDFHNWNSKASPSWSLTCFLWCDAATACYGSSSSHFPSSNMFAAAGEGIWDNGAACGRQYLVRCISAAVPRTCLPDQIIQVRIVDRAQTSRSRPSSNGATIVLSSTAFGTIADPSARLVNVEFQQ